MVDKSRLIAHHRTVLYDDPSPVGPNVIIPKDQSVAVV